SSPATATSRLPAGRSASDVRMTARSISSFVWYAARPSGSSTFTCGAAAARDERANDGAARAQATARARQRQEVMKLLERGWDDGAARRGGLPSATGPAAAMLRSAVGWRGPGLRE